MNNEIMKRAMFAMPMSKGEMNSGIMQGFEEPEDEMPQMARTPQNPEILMNNLRGDMRSIDARYMELAQMVGEEAAMETPPEVLAMLQPQLAAPAMPAYPAGIMQLPQGQEMMPPPGIGAQPGMPQAMPPGGMEGMPPFQPGGVEQTPPTPDGLPPVRAQAGGFFRSAARYGSEVMPAIDQYLGRLFGSVPENVYSTVPMVGADGRPIYLQGRETVRMTPSGPVMGEGTRITPATTLGVTDIRQPSLRRAIGEPFEEITGMAERGLNAARASYPRAMSVAEKSVVPALGAGTAAAMYQKLTTPISKPAESMVDQIPGQGPPLRDEKGREIVGPRTRGALYSGEAYTGEAPPAEEPPGATTAPPAALEKDQTKITKEEKGDQGINKLIEMLSKPSDKTKVQRIKEEQLQYEPLFKELLGDTKEELRTNALLLLADAGFKFAGSRSPTLGGAFAEATAELPKGLIAITSQLRDRGIKVKTASLQQAISSVEAADKLTKESLLKVLELQNKRDIQDQRTQVEVYKARLQYGAPTYERLPFGHVITNIKGQPPQQTINYEDPTVVSAINSDYTLTDANPYVSYRGKSPTTIQQTPEQLKEMSKQISAIENSLRLVDEAQRIVMDAYGPSSFFTSLKNNLIVPIVPDAVVSPDVDKAAKFSQLKHIFNTLSKEAADVGGRTAVQQQEWERQNIAPLSGPDEFWKNAEISAKMLAAKRTDLLNQRQSILEKAALIGERYEMRTPNTGTQNDPFVLPDPKLDPTGYKKMARFLAQTLGTIDRFDSRTKIWIVGPDGRKDWVTPDQLKKFGQ